MAPKRKQPPQQIVLSSSDDEDVDCEEVIQEKEENIEEAKRRKIEQEVYIPEIHSDEFDEDDDFDDYNSDEDDEEDLLGDSYDDSIGKPVSLYVARWPNGDFSMVSASSKANAAEILDEIDDPGHAIITQYRGPLFFDFTHKKPVFENIYRVFESKTKEFSKKERNSSIYKHFEELYKNKKDFDITIKFKDTSTGNNCSLKAHKLFLTIYSGYFKKYFEKNPTKNQITIGNSLDFITEKHVISFLDFMYTNQCRGESFTYFYQVALLGVNLECDILMLKACNQMIDAIRFDYQTEAMVFVLNETHKSQPLNLLFKALCSQVFKDVEKLRGGGLKKGVCETLSKFKDSHDNLYWNEDKEALCHDKFKLSSSTYSPADGYRMWDKLKATVFPLSHKRKKEAFKKAFIQEMEEGKQQSNAAVMEHPELALIMDRARLTSMDVINSWMSRMGGVGPTL